MKRTALTFSVLAVIAGAAHAQALNDPMRPPLFTSVAAVKAGPVLQTVVIGKEHRYAIISGERVMPGGNYGEAKVVSIVENEVILRDANGETVLKLYPEIKTPIVAPKVASRDAVQGGRGK